MESTSQTTSEPATGPSLANKDQIQWAKTQADKPLNESLQKQYEVARARNWISERLITQCQRHWHCSREEAIERLLKQQG